MSNMEPDEGTQAGDRSAAGPRWDAAEETDTEGVAAEGPRWDAAEATETDDADDPDDRPDS
jgi:hypothetical protein